mgnify:CR=1 FL=1
MNHMSERPLNISGVLPRLAMSAELGPPRTECGVGALMAWAGKLWAITYVSDGAASGVGTGLYVIDEDLTMTKHPASRVGTYTNRCVHWETNQMIIGPHIVDAMKNGAHDFLAKPLSLSQLEISINRACEIVQMRRELAHFRQSQQQSLNFVRGKSPVMEDVFNKALKAAQVQVSVLITGESGAGKSTIVNTLLGEEVSPASAVVGAKTTLESMTEAAAGSQGGQNITIGGTTIHIHVDKMSSDIDLQKAISQAGDEFDRQLMFRLRNLLDSGSLRGIGYLRG